MRELERVVGEQSDRLLRRGHGVRDRRHRVRGQGANRKAAPVVPGHQDPVPVDQIQMRQGHTVPVRRAPRKSGNYNK